MTDAQQEREPFDIRPAVPGDMNGILEIYNQAISERTTAHTEPISMEQGGPWFASHDPARRPILVASSGRDLRGWASLSDHRPGRQALKHTAEISYFVHRDHRRQGCAAQLVEACIARAPQLDVKSLFALFLETNQPSRRLLEKFGFRRWGHLPRVAVIDGREVGQLIYGLRVD